MIIRGFRILIHLMAVIGSFVSLNAQNFIGVGFHLTPPVRFDYTGSSNVTVKPQPGLAGSITYKKEWAYQSLKKWYLEAGVTTQGLRYYQVNYHGDSSAIWTDWVSAHLGFPSILLGGGHSFRIGHSKSAFSIGFESSLLLEQTLHGMHNRFFGISYDPLEYPTSALFLRLNLAYNKELNFFKTTGQLQIYTNLGFQNLTRGGQYMYVEEKGIYQYGRYSVNNSELGVKFFTCLNKKNERSAEPGKRDSKNTLPALSERKTKFRFSLNAQLYAPPQTVYHIPQVDSFSVEGKKFLLSNNQFGLTFEIPYRKNNLWSTVIGLGIGNRVATMIFRSDGRFPTDNQPIEFERHISFGYYSIANLGISRRQALGRQILSHTLSASCVFPLEREYEYLGVPLNFNGNGNQLPPYENPVLEGWVDYNLGRAPVVFGIEYNPEIIFNTRYRTFVALGLVVNYSGREVIGHGTFEVTNGNNSYYGAMLQKFSKLGMTLRVGLDK
jgi:hypothetical protein